MLEIAAIAAGIWWLTKPEAKPAPLSAFICTVVNGQTICQRRDGTGTPWVIEQQKLPDPTQTGTAIEGAWFSQL
jgi:hypothetical protein